MTSGVIFGLFVALFVAVCIVLFMAAKRQKADEGNFGSFYILFFLAFFLTSQLIGRFWYFQVIGDGLYHGLNHASDYIAEKIGTSTGQQQQQQQHALPSGNPEDYVEWVSAGEIQPKPGTSLPNGWRVSYTTDQKQCWVIDKTITVPDTGDLWILFDPDQTALPGAKPGPTFLFSNKRP